MGSLSFLGQMTIGGGEKHLISDIYEKWKQNT